MDGTSLTPEQVKLNALRQVLPEAFSEGKIDWEKLKATLGEDINFSNERYVLNWAGKSDAFKVLQTPTTRTLIPAKDESVNFDETENIFIEGENLEVLKVLQKSYFGKVKMIYIDPPYNTGNDSFIYPDKFSESKADYEKRVGDKDEEGYMTKDGMFKKNSKENGQYHSNWLNMMMPRLYLAKNLLRQDGAIFVSIDDNELHNLRLLLNEIFGEENFVAQITRATGTPTGGGGAKPIVNEMDYLLVYSKSPNLKFTGTPLTDEESAIYDKEDENGIYLIRPLRRTGGEDRREDRPTMYYPLVSPDETEVYPIAPAGYESRWICGKDKFDELNNANLIEWKQNGNNEWTVYQKFYLEGRLKQPGNLWTKVEGNKKATRDVRDLFEGKKIFDFPKPVGFISKILQISTDSNDLILDFFAGSGSTAHAVMTLNKEEKASRKYLCVQLPELCEEKSEAYKAGYKTIAEISKERIRRAGKKIHEEIKAEIKKTETEITKLQGELPTEETKTEIENLKTKIEKLKNQDLGFKVLKLEDSNFKQWQQIEGKDAKALAEQMKLFVDPISESATIENMVYELLLKSGKNLNSPIEKKDSYYKINGNELILLLEKATQEIIDAVIAEKPIKVIALDKLFKGNDQLKTNSVLQMKDAGIEFKTI
ncbi:MAG: site-specific DNA-methyltransferase [Candidatus Paceibacterota bacterium]|jgi:adenine-specific DNA-methyltransferase